VRIDTVTTNMQGGYNS